MDGYVTIGTKLDTKSFDKQIKEIEYRLEQLDYELSHAKELKLDKRTIMEYEKEAEKLNNQLIRLRKQQSDINKIDLSNISKGLTKVVSKVGKWALAVFGLRSAYMAVRNAINVITQDDAQLKADIDYIKTALAYSLEPVVRKIVELAKQLLIFVGYLINKWFKYDIFANANKSLANANKNAKELRKTLAGFDEMNILNENGSVGVAGNLMPSFTADYSEVERQLDKIKWEIKDVYDEMQNALYETDFDVWTDGFGEWDLSIYGITQTLGGLWGMFKEAIGTFEGLWHTIYGMVTGDTEEATNGFQKFIDKLGGWFSTTHETLIGIGNTFAGVFKAIIQTMWGWLFDFINKIIEKFNELKVKIENVWDKISDKIKNTIQNIQDWLTRKFGTTGAKIGEIIGASFKFVINGVLAGIEGMLNTPIRSINKLITTINKVPGIDLKTLDTFKFPRLAKGGIVNMPSRGVLVGSAIAGERGAEGVIPLTDSQQMALLGEAIGRYITVNANIVNTMNGRVISREIQKVQNESNFATNR